jgi:quercetin dioxygenase-like cupin family protein
VSPVPFQTQPGAGESLWFLDELMVVHADGARTNGAFALVEALAPQGPASPLHVQPNEDETFHVLEGEIAIHADGVTTRVPAGGTAFVPRGTPHAFAVLTETARLLVLNTPAGHEEFFRAMGRPAGHRGLPGAADGPPDMGAMAVAAADAGFEILGPPPAFELGAESEAARAA